MIIVQLPLLINYCECDLSNVPTDATIAPDPRTLRGQIFSRVGNRLFFSVIALTSYLCFGYPYPFF